VRENVSLGVLMALFCFASAHAAEPADVGRCSFLHDEIMTAFSNPARALNEYNDFFDKVHIPEVVSRGIGFEGAQRFRVLANMGLTPWMYLSVYGLERGNQIAETGVKFRPGTAPAAPPAPYLAEGSVAWILRRVATTAVRDSKRGVDCPTGQKVFVVIPQAGGPELDIGGTLRSIPGLLSAERYDFSKSTKGPAPAWTSAVLFRSSAAVDVSATLRRLGAVVGCAGGTCSEASGAVWVLEPQGDYVSRADLEH